jgi:hypothetical protein
MMAMSASPTARSWRTRLRIEISWLLAAKVAALVVLWLLFFGPWHRPRIDAHEVADRLAPSETHTAH